MINKRKVRLMARTAMYEKHEGTKAFKKNAYYKTDYVGLHMLLAGLSVTIGLMLIAALICIYKFDFIINNLTTIDYRQLFSIIVVVYVLTLIGYLIVTYFVYSFRYEDDMQGVRMYISRLKRINELAKNDEKKEEEDQ